MDRRDVMKAAALGLATATVGPGARAAPGDGQDAAAAGPGWHIETLQGGERRATGPVTSRIPQDPRMKYRPLGRTGELVSLVGVGGFHLAKPGGATNAEAIRIVHAAIDHGVTFFDNCWDYNGGESEVRLGRALARGWRDRVFLMTKLDGRTAQSATRQLDQSLARLGTDHLDLLQIHEVIRMDDPDRVFAPGGAIEALMRAREQGKFRYVGFTGHKSPAIHLHMFDLADRHGFHFDTVQMPLNVMDAHYDSFERHVLPVALAHGTAVLGMKTFGDPFIYNTHAVPPIEMLHYPMSLPVSVQITGIDRMPILQQALDAVRTWQPMTQPEREAILARTAQFAQNGHTELYKTTTHFDGTVRNPSYLG